MCLSKVYILENGQEHMILDSVSNIRMENGKITLSDILGETKTVRGMIQDVDLIRNTVLIRTGDYDKWTSSQWA